MESKNNYHKKGIMGPNSTVAPHITPGNSRNGILTLADISVAERNEETNNQNA